MVKICTGFTHATRRVSWVVPPTFGWLVASKNKHLRKTLDKKEAGTVICSSEYDLDPAGMRLGRTLSDGKYDAWSYDPNYQLRTESRWSAKTPGTQTYRKEFDYDGNGNRAAEYADGVKTATTVGDNNQLTAVGEFDIMTDFMGNTIDISDGVTDEFFEYNWERNLMTAYLDESQSDTHEYDGDGRCMRSRLNSASNWTHFVHDELTEQVLGEFTLVSTTFTLKAANTYGWGLISSNRETVKRYFHFDGLGNTLCLTDTSETTQDSYAFTAFGTPLSSTGSSVNPYRYVGKWGYYDDGAMGSPHDFVLCGIRYYAPSFGRFLTWDPIGSRGYGYCGNEVTMAMDPDGHQLTGVRKTPLNPPPGIIGVSPPGVPPVGGSCREWNDFIYNYCNACYSGTRPAWENCKDRCSNWASWYYDNCKPIPSRFKNPGETWEPRPLPGRIVPINPPPIKVGKDPEWWEAFLQGILNGIDYLGGG